jgi:ABC-type transport system involved in cytochrome c biogenesis ATPase subunit
LRRVTGLRIEGLFGYVTHEVRFRSTEPTIIVGPNGAGKTHVLELLRATLSLDAKVLLSTLFSSLTVEFSDSRGVRATRTFADDSGAQVSLVPVVAGRPVGAPLTVTTRQLDEYSAAIPSHIKRQRGDRWLDTHTGRRYDRETLEARFRTKVDFPWVSAAPNPALDELCGPPRPVFIDTKRLDVAGADAVGPDWASGTSGRHGSEAASRIHEYTEQLRAEVIEARGRSIRATQSADLSFAARALAASRLSVKEADLHIRYDETVERYEALARNGLAVGEAPISFPDSTTPTVRRILSVFLDDWDKRLEPLLPLNEKLQTLRDILDSKLEPSGKRTVMSPRGDLEFRSFSDRRIRVSRLSSGEQHLVALFTMLLFAAKPGSLVLIDEPEISLHAAWKHSFLADITRVASISELQIVLATHSSAVVNGRWDLTEELTLNAATPAVVSGEPDEESDELDD